MTEPSPACEPDSHGWIGTETVQSRFGNFEFKNQLLEAVDSIAAGLLRQRRTSRLVLPSARFRRGPAGGGDE